MVSADWNRVHVADLEDMLFDDHKTHDMFPICNGHEASITSEASTGLLEVVCNVLFRRIQIEYPASVNDDADVNENGECEVQNKTFPKMIHELAAVTSKLEAVSKNKEFWMIPVDEM